MANSTIAVGRMNLAFPSEYSRLKRLPDDPEGLVPFALQTDEASCFIKLLPIPLSEAMPFDDITPIVDGIHASLDEYQGLVEVKVGSTAQGRPFAYSIVKTSLNSIEGYPTTIPGVQYVLTMDIGFADEAASIVAFFDERGTTGIRDSTVFAALRNDQVVHDVGPGDWARDPYDDGYTKGLLMNLSELPQYDDAFPWHPLSLTRGLVSSILSDN